MSSVSESTERKKSMTYEEQDKRKEKKHSFSGDVSIQKKHQISTYNNRISNTSNGICDVLLVTRQRERGRERERRWEVIEIEQISYWLGWTQNNEDITYQLNNTTHQYTCPNILWKVIFRPSAIFILSNAYIEHKIEEKPILFDFGAQWTFLDLLVFIFLAIVKHHIICVCVCVSVICTFHNGIRCANDDICRIVWKR